MVSFNGILLSLVKYTYGKNNIKNATYNCINIKNATYNCILDPQKKKKYTHSNFLFAILRYHSILSIMFDKRYISVSLPNRKQYYYFLKIYQYIYYDKIYVPQFLSKNICIEVLNLLVGFLLNLSCHLEYNKTYH